MRKASEKPLLTLVEAGGVNEMPVVVEPAAATSPVLIEAIEAVKAAGYRVSKPKKPIRFKRSKDRVGPTFVAKFADGEVTRMSVFTPLEKLDWNRGARLSQAAWQSRWRTRERFHEGRIIALFASTPPEIVSAHFEQDGKVLAQREFLG